MVTEYREKYAKTLSKQINTKNSNLKSIILVIFFSAGEK